MGKHKDDDFFEEILETLGRLKINTANPSHF